MNTYASLDQLEIVLKQDSRSYHNQVEKITKYETELSSLESSIKKQNEFRDEFNDNFKRGLDKFEFEKVEEFKGMIEIYWEGLIESQKELIELWESFYDKCKFEDA
ncbi:unnamed protein product [Ambrosiozyma monospora]|uniref:Unnamed protein product n=1 Tax=Ambrosiozyma monospora TaxID=43982 RepID=A0ACB5UB32_AMBMO|nr:unnamed protein product [Ambrosiozyma monospora]